MSGVVWVEGVRVSTLATLALFGLVGLVRGGDRRALWSAAAWLAGFEIAYQTTAVAMGTCRYPAAAPYFVGIGLVVIWLTRKRVVRPPMEILAVVLLVWLVWIAFGFHANQHETPQTFSVLDEVLNVSAKTVWALAYLTPLWKRQTAAVAG